MDAKTFVSLLKTFRRFYVITQVIFFDLVHVKKNNSELAQISVAFHGGKERKIQTDRLTEKDRQTDRQTDRQSERKEKTDRKKASITQTDRQTDRQIDRETKTDRQTKIDTNVL